MVPKNHPAASLVDRALSIQPMLYTLLAVWMLLTASPARSEPVSGSMDVHWKRGRTELRHELTTASAGASVQRPYIHSSAEPLHHV
jgi:hypothetical protein